MNNSYKIYASKEYVDEKVASLVDSAPDTLNTLNELANALGDDPNFATTITTELGNKALKTDLDSLVKKSGDTMTNNLKISKNVGESTSVMVENPNRCITLAVHSNSGVYDETNTKWVFSSPANSTDWTFHGKAENVTGTVAVANGGTGATTAASARTNLGITPTNIGAVASSGDVMTGGLTVPDFTISRKNNYNVLKVFLDDKTTGFLQQDINSNRFKFIQVATDTTFSESYQLPRPAYGLTEAKTYEFLTSKSPVTVEQGGTGANSAANARANLGITMGQTGIISFSANHTADSKDVTINFGKTYSSAPKVFLSPYYNNHTNSTDIHKVWYEVISVNTTSCVARVLYPTGATSALNLYLNWVAIG